MSELDDFAESLRQDVTSEARLEGAETMRAEAFTARMILELSEAGEIDDGTVAPYRARGIEVSGYSVADEGERLDLFLSIYTQTVPPVTVTRDQVETAFTRMIGFFDRARTDLVKAVEESTPAFDMALTVSELKELRKLRLFVLTDGRTTVRERASESRGDLQLSFHVWDIRRLFQVVTSGQQQESIDIDFVKRFGAPLPCLVAPHTWTDYQAHLAVIPGPVLAAIYDEFGTRLLERNVRAFLQTRGKVNSGIRNTILNEP